MEHGGRIYSERLYGFANLPKARTRSLPESVVDASCAIVAFANLSESPNSARTEMNSYIACGFSELLPRDIVVNCRVLD
jgi:hypothetical protein